MEEHKMEMKELEEVCKPIVEFLKKKASLLQYYS